MTDSGGAFTTRPLDAAGIGAGMHVLDIGSGTGDVALRVARLVGGAGSVLGIDVNADAVAGARQRATDEGVGNARFEVVDGVTPPAELGRFDAITCRRVLMYRADRVEMLQVLRPFLVPGGRAAVQEHDATLHASSEPLPLHDRVRHWIWSTVEHEGADTGLALHSVLTRAGFRVEGVFAEALVQTPDAAQPSAAIVRAILPRILAAGIATEAEIDVETLDARLADELSSAGATYVGETVFGAWACVASSSES